MLYLVYRTVNLRYTRHTKQLEIHGGVLSSVEQALRLCFACVAPSLVVL